MVKHSQTIRRQKPTNCLSVFDHFVNLALKGLKFSKFTFLWVNYQINYKYTSEVTEIKKLSNSGKAYCLEILCDQNRIPFYLYEFPNYIRRIEKDEVVVFMKKKLKCLFFSSTNTCDSE